MSFVECKQVVKAYKVANHEIVALRGIDFEMQQGEMVAIIGPSGAGKSSLLNLLGGLDNPTAGSLLVDGQNLLELKGRNLADYRLTQVGFIWQQVERNLLPQRSALRNVTLPMMMSGISPFKRGDRAKDLLEAVDMTDHMSKRPVQLSGGQQQRVSIAVALANEPKLLLADEPTGALDHDNAVAVMNLLMELRERYGLTVLMVTHDMEIAEYADRILTLRDGALAQDMSGDEDDHRLDDEGRIRLPQNVKAQLSNAARISIEMRPEGVLLRPEKEDIDNTEALLEGMLPQDAPPDDRNIFQKIRGWFRRGEDTQKETRA